MPVSWLRQRFIEREESTRRKNGFADHPSLSLPTTRLFSLARDRDGGIKGEFQSSHILRGDLQKYSQQWKLGKVRYLVDYYFHSNVYLLISDLKVCIHARDRDIYKNI